MSISRTIGFALTLGSLGVAAASPSFAQVLTFGALTPTQVNSNPSEAYAVGMDTNSVAVLSNGNYVVAWGNYASPLTGGETGTDQFRIFNSSGQAVSEIVTIDTDSALLPNVAGTSNGKFAIEYETNGQVWVQFFTSNGTPLTLATAVGAAGHLGSIASAGGNGVVVTWTEGVRPSDDGPSYAQFFNKNGSQRTGAVEIASSGSWSGNVTRLKADEFVASWGGTPSAVLFNGTGAISSSFSPSLTGANVFVQALGTSAVVLSGPESTQFEIVHVASNATVTDTLGSDVGSYPYFQPLNGTNKFAMFYTKPDGVQPYYLVFNYSGKIVQKETELTQVTNVSANGGSATPVWFNGLISRETTSGSFIFAWIDSSGILWTGVTD